MKTFGRIATAAVAAFSAVALCACTGGGPDAGAPSAGTGEGDMPLVRIGTMPTEDILPVWVAQRDGMFEDAGVRVEVETFDSAASLSAALTAGQVDLAMTDTMRAVKLCESGVDVRLEWVTLGETAAEGRFGVMTGPESGIETLSDLVGSQKGVGVAANTVPEYVFDMLCRQAGVDPAAVTKVEVASLPDRYTLMANGQLDAAALPGSMLAMGEAAGLVLLADDTQGQNVSQSVMVARSSFADVSGELVMDVAHAWNEAANAINVNPEAFRELLVEKSNLNSAIAESYPISTYPDAVDAAGDLIHPAADMVQPVIDWMVAAGYAEAAEYDAYTGSITAG